MFSVFYVGTATHQAAAPVFTGTIQQCISYINSQPASSISDDCGYIVSTQGQVILQTGVGPQDLFVPTGTPAVSDYLAAM